MMFAFLAFALLSAEIAENEAAEAAYHADGEAALARVCVQADVENYTEYCEACCFEECE